MQPDNTETDGALNDDLIDRMNAIRNASERHVVRMHAEAERLVDWREHVRSQPLLAVGVATAAGFFLMYRSRSKTAPQPSPQAAAPKSDTAQETATRSSIASGTMAFVGTMAGNMLKQYATNYVKTKLAGVVHHDRNTDEQSEAHSLHASQPSGRW